MPGLRLRLGRRLHAWVGAGLAVAVHVAALWLTSPPDVVDALLFRSPTPFSVWGVVAMWAVFATALLAPLRGWLRLRLMIWRLCHMILALAIVVGSVVHAMLIDGTMELVSKALLSALVVAAAAKVMVDLRFLADIRRMANRHGLRAMRTATVGRLLQRWLMGLMDGVDTEWAAPAPGA